MFGLVFLKLLKFYSLGRPAVDGSRWFSTDSSLESLGQIISVVISNTFLGYEILEEMG